MIDGHDSHVNIEFVAYCDGNNITLLCLPPHTTHLLQPPDLGLFRPLQQHYGNEVDRAARNGGIAISKVNLLALQV